MNDKNKAGMGAGEVEALVAGLREKIAGKRKRGRLLRHTASHLQVDKGQELEQDADLLEQCADTIDALARQLSEAQVPEGWVPISERLPELEQPVALLNAERFENCHFDRNIQAAGYLDNFGGRSRPYWSVRGEPALEISAFTHWLALPAALPAQSQERGAPEVECPKCKGSGDKDYLVGSGPDAYLVADSCDGCNGEGMVASAPAAGESEGKPSWKDAPEWAQWLAQDSRGVWRWYAAEPSQGRDSLWFAPLENARETYAFRPNPNWRNTLEQRPAQAGEEE